MFSVLCLLFSQSLETPCPLSSDVLREKEIKFCTDLTGSVPVDDDDDGCGGNVGSD